MTRSEFRALLDMLMVSDPWPEPCFTVLEEYANKVGKIYGFKNWIDAYHEFKGE